MCETLSPRCYRSSSTQKAELKLGETTSVGSLLTAGFTPYPRKLTDKKPPHFGKSAWTGSPLGLWSLTLKPAGFKCIAWFWSCPSGLTYAFVFHPGLFKPSHFITGSLKEFPLMEEMFVYAAGH